MTHDPNEIIWQRQEADSPCIKLCTIHPQERICIGCLRTMEEIGTWSRMAREKRLAIMAELPERAPRLKKRRGGRAKRQGQS